MLPSADNNDVPLRHGYTVGQARSICLGLLKGQTWYQSADFVSFDQRLEVAWHAVIEHLYASDQPPSPHEIMQAAERAVNHDVHGIRQFYGRNSHGRYAGTIIKGFERYWWFTATPAPGPENKVTERVALAQIWARLHPGHRRVLAALAGHGDHTAAAAALGITPRQFTSRLSDARQAFLRLWHEGETPSRVWCTSKATARRHRRERRARQAAETGQPPQPRPAPFAPPRASLGISDAELVRRYEAGESVRQLAASLSAHHSTVLNRLRTEGAQIRPANGQQARR
jgi:DNA-directed RNA polymerase specialized sigma24 family protein